jgi:hypothetical protein
MIACQNCGQNNADDCNFCRFCGTKIILPLAQRTPNYNYAPPRPYAWKTDELQTQTESRRQSEAMRQPQQQSYSSNLASYRYSALDQNYRCPQCGTSYLPVIEKRISSAGWVTFSLLLVFTVIFFWVGLLMKEDVAVCPVCKARLN